MKQLTDDQHVLLLIKVKFKDNQIKTLSNKQTINKDCKNDLLELILDRLGHSNEAYNSAHIIEIIFYYKINWHPYLKGRVFARPR